MLLFRGRYCFYQLTTYFYLWLRSDDTLNIILFYLLVSVAFDVTLLRECVVRVERALY